jgi:hypothetical protein
MHLFGSGKPVRHCERHPQKTFGNRSASSDYVGLVEMASSWLYIGILVGDKVGDLFRRLTYDWYAFRVSFHCIITCVCEKWGINW